ncbi:alpha/beta hydrolase [Pacificibacter sp. AS14]|uniref:alpha/beta fold hydrolase n=1 Tax=Pacificibacter sp. AS14 TaxID=3135785 RepID=UPI00317D6270
MGFEPHISEGLSYFERAGDGPVLVCLHGIGSNAGSFSRLLTELPMDWRVIAWNAPGYLNSIPLTMDWPAASDYADALLALFDRLNLDRISLLGHSLGCLAAAAAALRTPERLETMILACCALGHGFEQGSVLSSASQKRISDLEALGPKGFAAERAGRLVFEPEHNAEVADFVMQNMSEVSMPGYGQAARLLAGGKLLDDLSDCAVPTSVIFGAEDVITPPENSRKAYAALSEIVRGQLISIAGAGHAAYQQCPKEFAAAVTRCLSSSGEIL